MLCFFPSEQGAGLAVLLHDDEEADEAQGQHGVCRCQAGEQTCVPGTGEGQDQGQDECAQAELFDALHGAQFRIAVLEKFLGSFQSLDFSAHGQHTHTEVDAQGADHGVRQNVDEPVGIHKFFAGEVLQRCDCGLVHSAADGGTAAA